MGFVFTAAAEAAIGWVVQSILGSFFTGQMQVWTHEVGLVQEVEELETEMRTIQMVLTAAERSKIDNKPLSESLDELKELIYDAEDVMDELDYYRLQQQIEGKCYSADACSNPEGSCASSSAPSYFHRIGKSVTHNISWAVHGQKRKREEEEPTHSSMLPLEIKHDISKRIHGIVNRLRSRGKPVHRVLKLEVLRQTMMPNQSVPRKLRQTTSVPIERKVYGRDLERDNIIELLTKGNSGDLGVLPLVGVGGVATTRRTSVARMIGTMNKVEVNGLDETEFWLLFKACAFLGNENQENDPTLQSIGKQIAEALRGNPLAARSVGALLNRSVSFEHWRKVQYKWKSLLEQDDDILAILKFSYEFLPVQLQHCFSYCSLFPKDHKFNGDKLISAWISQNFVKCECHTERLEETGKLYLDNLVDWGFFEEINSHYVMHDLMHDLAEKVSSNECATIDGLGSRKMPPNVRHLSIITTAYDKDKPCDFPTEKFENTLQSIRSLQKLRTLMFFGNRCTVLCRSLHTLCKESTSLRLLRIYVTADDINNVHNLLKPYHLRYLEFDVNPTFDTFGYGDIVINTSIPQSLTQFYHLQVLDASSQANLAVPTGINNLINLRHLIAHEKVHSEIAAVGNLTSLQELKFKVRDANNFNIAQLQSMNELITLRICQLENVKTEEEAKSASLIDKEHLKMLSLSWDDNSMSPEPTAEKTRDNVLEGLEPHQNLKHLQLTRYSGATSPTWLANKVTSLQTLHLENCRGWQIVQSLETLPVLRKLKLINMWNLMEVSIPYYLEELVLVNMPRLKKCVGTYGQDLTSGLRVLMVKDCPEMGALKELELMDVPVVEELSIPSLEKLVLIQMPSLQCCSGITASPPLQVSTSQVDQKELVSSLRKLTIHDCPCLIVSLPMPPSPLISDLSIKGLSTFPTMVTDQGTFTIESCELGELDGRILPFHNLKGIRLMYLKDFPNLSCISSEVFSQLIALEHLYIWGCPNLFHPQVVSEKVHENSTPDRNDFVLPSLKSFSIWSCGISGRWLTEMLPHLHSLEDLELWDCRQIKLLLISQPTETEANSLASAETTLARDEQLLQVPCNVLRSLKHLHISKCPDLEFPAGVSGGFGECTSLVKLQIQDCPKLLRSNTSLKCLQIRECPHLGFLDGLQHLSSLQILDIGMNPDLSAAWDLKLQEQEQSGNQVGLLPLSLVEFEMSKLEGRVNSSFMRLPSIKKLGLWDSPELVSVQLGYCTALEELEIRRCKSLASVEGFQSMKNLRSLKVLGSPTLSRNLEQQGTSEFWSRLEILEISDPAVLSMPLCKQLTSLRDLQFNCLWSDNDETMVLDVEFLVGYLHKMQLTIWSRCHLLQLIIRQ
uniref:Rx N-terminal domain-containing protein n=1 Tax=Oryza punctata TaxID=4537 RepID=A0A0E0JUR0_ORYPU